MGDIRSGTKEKWVVNFRIYFGDDIQCDIVLKGKTYSGCGKTRLEALTNAYTGE